MWISSLSRDLHCGSISGSKWSEGETEISMATITPKRPIYRNPSKGIKYYGRAIGSGSKQRKQGFVWPSLSTFLFARPSFLEGIGRIFDLGNTLNEYNRSQTPQDADARALASDWRVVGEEIASAEANFNRQLYSSSSR